MNRNVFDQSKLRPRDDRVVHELADRESVARNRHSDGLGGKPFGPQDPGRTNRRSSAAYRARKDRAESVLGELRHKRVVAEMPRERKGAGFMLGSPALAMMGEEAHTGQERSTP